MTSIAVSPMSSIDLQNEERVSVRSTELSEVAPSEPTAAASADVSTCGHDFDECHFLWEAFDDHARMADGFTMFSETLVPLLAGLSIERPSVIAQDFDLRYDNGRLRVIDTNMSPDDVSWFETRLNSHPSLSKLAHLFNQAVVEAYGDGEHDAHIMERGDAFVAQDAIPGLGDTVDRDVKFMSLLRTVRDADCGSGTSGAYYEGHRYELAATKVLDFITSPETYRRTASGELALTSRRRSSMAEWNA